MAHRLAELSGVKSRTDLGLNRASTFVDPNSLVPPGPRSTRSYFNDPAHVFDQASSSGSLGRDNSLGGLDNLAAGAFAYSTTSVHDQHPQSKPLPELSRDSSLKSNLSAGHRSGPLPRVGSSTGLPPPRPTPAGPALSRSSRQASDQPRSVTEEGDWVSDDEPTILEGGQGQWDDGYTDDDDDDDDDDDAAAYYEDTIAGYGYRPFRVLLTVTGLCLLWLMFFIIFYGTGSYTLARGVTLTLTLAGLLACLVLLWRVPDIEKWRASKTHRLTFQSILMAVVVVWVIATCITGLEKGFRLPPPSSPHPNAGIYIPGAIRDGVAYRGRVYAALDKVSAQAAPMQCRDHPTSASDLTLPSGWSLASDTSDLRLVLAGSRFRFGANCVVVSGNAVPIDTSTGGDCVQEQHPGCTHRHLVTRLLNPRDNMVTLRWLPQRSVHYTAQHESYLFATLTNTIIDAPNGSDDVCMDIAHYLPYGWSLAPDDLATREAVRGHMWGSQCLVLASGTGLTPVDSEPCGTDLLGTINGGYYVKQGACSSKILIRQHISNDDITALNPFAQSGPPVPVTAGGNRSTTSNATTFVQVYGTVLPSPDWSRVFSIADILITKDANVQPQPVLYITLAGTAPVPTPSGSGTTISSTTGATGSVIIGETHHLGMSQATSTATTTTTTSTASRSIVIKLFRHYSEGATLGNSNALGVKYINAWTSSPWGDAGTVSTHTGSKPDLLWYDHSADPTRLRALLRTQLIAANSAFPLRPQALLWSVTLTSSGPLGLFTAQESMSKLALSSQPTKSDIPALMYVQSGMSFDDNAPGPSVQTLLSPTTWSLSKQWSAALKELSQASDAGEITKAINEHLNEDNMLTWLASVLVFGDSSSITSGVYLYRANKDTPFYFLPACDPRGWAGTASTVQSQVTAAIAASKFLRLVLRSRAYASKLYSKAQLLSSNIGADGAVEAIIRSAESLVRPVIGTAADWTARTQSLINSASEGLQGLHAALALNELPSPTTILESQYVTLATVPYVKVQWQRLSMQFATSKTVVYDVVISDDAAGTDIIANVTALTANDYFVRRDLLKNDERYFIRVSSYTTADPTVQVPASNTYTDPDGDVTAGLGTFKTPAA
eukprot:TRINITY_DN1062_c0_g1_i1.p1 TRINITY_DN1062_c0_g1~~TRINITY_DN1062_c0_g1_i1.p1  ORF type:complete len:1117 (+),score=210.08 TRINITY_DN1062_c0_g1_i1:161-3511(+)